MKIDPGKISFKTDSFKKEPGYWAMAESRFHDMQLKKRNAKVDLESGGKALNIEVISESDNMGK